MINTKSLEAVGKSRLNSAFVKPAYGSYCFSHIPDTIAKVFGLPAAQPLPADVLPAWDGFDCVILFYMDAFGWRFFEQFAERSPFLQEMLRNGVVSQMTSMFPSTTSAHATTIHTGMDVNTSGVSEWYYYEPTIGEVMSPLTFSLTDHFAHDGLLARGVQPADVFLPQTLYAKLAEGGVQSCV
jgi:hypothetical protein